jgi:hypothetical protein
VESVVGVVAGMEVVLVGKSVRVAVVSPGDGWTLVTPRGRVTHFRGLWRLREARNALLMISPSLLPKAAMSIGAGSPLIESERSGSSGLCSLSGALFL